MSDLAAIQARCKMLTIVGVLTSILACAAAFFIGRATGLSMPVLLGLVLSIQVSVTVVFIVLLFRQVKQIHANSAQDGEDHED